MHQKRLEGLKLTESWKKLLDQALLLAGTASKDNTETDNIKDDGTCGSDEGLTVPSPMWPMSRKQAITTLQSYYNQRQEQQSQGASTNFLPLPVALSIATILAPDCVDVAKALSEGSVLAFTLPPTDQILTDEQKRFRRRMERLQLKQEEERYSNLTRNLNLSVPDDDHVTTRSMTYAASIGLNMIIAPLCFGCFMWFFGGSLLDYLWPLAPQTRPGASSTDIRRVIVGVTSGVLMLFVEMLLFVIRTHELDRAMRIKSKQNKKVGPFGYYTSQTARTFKED